MPEKQTVKLLVEGGKATPTPPLGPALSAAKLNVGQVVSAINDKTREFGGMQVPVSVIFDTKTKEFEIKVGSPPVSALIKKEIGVKLLAKTAGKEAVGDLKMEQIVKIAKSKIDGMSARTARTAAKQVVGTCLSVGVTVEGRSPKEIMKEIDNGFWDEKFK